MGNLLSLLLRLRLDSKNHLRLSNSPKNFKIYEHTCCAIRKAYAPGLLQIAEKNGKRKSEVKFLKGKKIPGKAGYFGWRFN
ncbi:TPA: hypothetical protein DCX24_01135 [Candidatus Azambacteria bacterium]|nr:hypothetical protein [Rheinheimera sp.]HAW91510.1 hypothetical protein [Candidatus Azambacteria bacterium]